MDFKLFLLVYVDKPSARSKREVFDLPSPVNYQQDYVIETLVVADKKMTNFHGVEELKTYVPSLINIVSNRKKSWYVIFFALLYRYFDIASSEN